MTTPAPPLTLAERMAEALKDCCDVSNIGERVKAYDAADLGYDFTCEFMFADHEAMSTELLRRLGGANDPA
jgi:hypothetical protein